VPADVLQPAGERFVEFCRALLFDAKGPFPDGIPITVIEVSDKRYIADWAFWRPIGSEGWWHGRRGVTVTASYLGYAVGNQNEQAAVLLAAGLHEIVREDYGRWCREAQDRANGMIWAIAAIYPELRSPYHRSTNQTLPESLVDDAYAANECEPLGKRFADEDLIRSVVRDVEETFRKNELVFCLDSFRKHQGTESGTLCQLIGRSSL
jgi:hypothetical protein